MTMLEKKKRNRKLIALIVAIIVYIGFIDPWLISAESTIAVLTGIALAVGLGVATIKIIKSILPPKKKKPSEEAPHCNCPCPEPSAGQPHVG